LRPEQRQGASSSDRAIFSSVHRAFASPLTRLLGAGILIVEHMANLGALPRDGFRFYAVPLRIVRGASFPVRAFAEVDRRR
jgi:kynurenine formamidase